MGRRTTEAIVKVEVAKRGVQIVTPQQADNPPAEPYAFRITRRAVYGLLSLGKFISLLCLLLAVGGRRLIGWFGVTALGKSRRAEDRSRSTQCDRYAEHTMEHGSLKFFWPFLVMKRAFPG